MTAPAKKTATKAAAKPVKPAKLPVAANVSIYHSMVLLCVCFVMVSALGAFVYGHQRTDLMLAISQESQLTPLQASDSPNTSSEALLNWSKMAVSEIFTYNFNNIVERMNASMRFFTPDGWQAFRSAFQEQQILGLTTGQRRFVTTMPTGTAVIVQEGDIGGVYTWTIQLGAVTNIYTGQSNISGGVYTLNIERVPTRSSNSGYPFGIYQVKQ